MRLQVACDFTAIREAQKHIRDWLARQGVPEVELAAWDFVLIEVGNNAVKHAIPSARSQPVELEVFLGEAEIEARITDHTAGFDLPATVELPDVESESGRGLFLVKSLTDHAAYFRGADANTFLLHKHRMTTARSKPN